MTIRVLVADDQALVRGSFRILVDTAPDLASVGEAATGTEAVELARRGKPDIVLMDIRMPGMDGIEATRQITAAAETSAVRVLILTTFDLDEYVFARYARAPADSCSRHPARRPAGRHPGGRGRRRAARPRRHPEAHRGVHPASRTPAAPQPRSG
jgi:DNA-binding NarL/FixJ family response regulator